MDEEVTAVVIDNGSGTCNKEKTVTLMYGRGELLSYPA